MGMILLQTEPAGGRPDGGYQLVVLDEDDPLLVHLKEV
jgi:hypothetical protein